MKGTIVKNGEEFLVEYLNTYGIVRTVPVYKPKADLIEGTQVDFEIVDEFSHPKLFADVALFEGVPHGRILGE